MAEQETDHEEVVLNRWERIKKWWEMINATYKAVRWTMMLLKLTAVGTTAAVVVDEVVETTFVEDGATALGLRDEAPPMPSSITAEEFEKFIEWQRSHDHDWVMPEHSHEMPEHTHNFEIPDHTHPEAPHRHEDHVHASHTHPEIEARTGQSGASQGTIDDALKRHIEEDH